MEVPKPFKIKWWELLGALALVAVLMFAVSLLSGLILQATMQKFDTTPDQQLVWATEVLAIATTCLILTGIVQLYLMLKHAKSLELGVINIQQLAEAARDSADIAKYSLTRIDRPWVGSDDPHFKATGTQSSDIVFGLTNFGNSPAFLLNWKLSAFNPGQLPTYSEFELNLSKSPSRVVIFPKGQEKFDISTNKYMAGCVYVFYCEYTDNVGKDIFITCDVFEYSDGDFYNFSEGHAAEYVQHT